MQTPAPSLKANLSDDIIRIDRAHIEVADNCANINNTQLKSTPNDPANYLEVELSPDLGEVSVFENCGGCKLCRQSIEHRSEELESLRRENVEARQVIAALKSRLALHEALTSLKTVAAVSSSELANQLSPEQDLVAVQVSVNEKHQHLNASSQTLTECHNSFSQSKVENVFVIVEVIMEISEVCKTLSDIAFEAVEFMESLSDNDEPVSEVEKLEMISEMQLLLMKERERSFAFKVSTELS